MGTRLRLACETPNYLALSNGNPDAMEALKLLAFDSEDLRIVSAHVQDAVMKVADLKVAASARSFSVEMNRFVWEK